MRKLVHLKNQKLKIRSRLVSAISHVIPSVVYKWILEWSFYNFGAETTNICNADCSFCGYRHMERRKKTIEETLFQKIVDEYDAKGGGVFNFTPTVGDPLVNKNIVSMIRYAAERENIDEVFLYTNGILINRIGVEALLTSGLARLAISTYVGTAENYKKYYGKDKYETVIRNIKDIAKENIRMGKPVRITLHLRVDMAEEDWRRSADFEEISQYIGDEDISYLTEYDSWSGLVGKDDLPKGCTIAPTPSMQEKKTSPCFELYRRLHVMADGKVGACVCADLEGEIDLGNVNEQSLTDIWRGEKLARYRTEWRNGVMPKVCASCSRYLPLRTYVDGNRSVILTNFIRYALKSLNRRNRA